MLLAEVEADRRVSQVSWEVSGGSVELAKTVLTRDGQVDFFRDQMFRELLTYMMENASVVFPAFELILVAKNLERVGDHATNIAEAVIYMAAGHDVRHHALDRR